MKTVCSVRCVPGISGQLQPCYGIGDRIIGLDARANHCWDDVLVVVDHEAGIGAHLVADEGPDVVRQVWCVAEHDDGVLESRHDPVEEELGQLVGGIRRVGSASSEYHILRCIVGEVPEPTRGFLRPTAHLMLPTAKNQVVLAVEVLDQVTRMVTGETPCAQVAPVVGEQQLVHPAEGERGVARKHGAEDVADEPEELQGFGERLRGTLCDGVAARGGFVQAGAPSGAGIPAGGEDL